MAKDNGKKKQEETVALAVPDNVVGQLEQVEQQLQAVQDLPTGPRKMFALPAIMTQMREALETKGSMDAIMQLQGNRLGFRTDKDPEGKHYPEKVVRDVTIWAMAHGAWMVNNEVNIIAGNGYLTKEYYERKVRELVSQGLVSADPIEYSSPELKGEWSKTVAKIRYRMGGEEKVKELPILVRVTRGMTIDAILGKVARRANKWLFEFVTGKITPDGEVPEGGDFIDVQATAATDDGDTATDTGRTKAKPMPNVEQAEEQPQKAAESQQQAEVEETPDQPELSPEKPPQSEDEPSGVEKVKAVCKNHKLSQKDAITFLQSEDCGYLAESEGLDDLTDKQISTILNAPDAFCKRVAEYVENAG